MNRGKSGELIFYYKKYYQAFLETLNEVNIRFECIIYAYYNIRDRHLELYPTIKTGNYIKQGQGA